MHLKCLLSCICLVAASQQGLAQSIAPDGTLGAETSRIVPVDAVTDLIEAGAVRGPNLFHSFEAFNVDAGRAAYFANPIGITHIFSRVTGNEGSNILGVLGVEGNANLYLLNPNGIFFGANAQLDINGAFIGSTAEQFTFGDDLSFSATTPEVSLLLNMNIEPGLQVGNATAGSIVVEGDLEVGQGFILEANQVEITGGKLSSSDHISIFATDSVLMNDGTVETALDRNGLGKAGDISIKARHFGAENRSLILSTSESEIKTDRLEEQGTGNISIVATDSFFLGGGRQLDGSIDGSAQSTIMTNQMPDSFGYSGDIEIESPTLTVEDRSKIWSKHEGEGGGGNIRLDAGVGNIRLIDKFTTVKSSTEETGIGNSGDVLLNAGEIDVLQATVYVESLPREDDPGSGNAGKITFKASEEINFGTMGESGFPPGALIGSEVKGRGGSETGGLSVKTKRFRITDGSFLVSTSQGELPNSEGAGDIDIIATESFTIADSEIISNLGNNGERNGIDKVGNSGAITISSSSITAENARITSGSQGIGDGGRIRLVTEGGAINLNNNVLIASAIGDKGIGKAGDIDLEARDIVMVGPEIRIESVNQSKDAGSRGGDIGIVAEGTLDMRGGIRVLSSLGQSEFRRTSLIKPNADWRRDENGEPIDFGLGSRGKAGNISVSVDQLRMDDASFEANTFGFGDAGDIDISASNSIVIENSLDAISTKIGIDSSSQAASGSSGNISISAPSLMLLGGSRIISSTQGNGSAGNIDISTRDNLTINGRLNAAMLDQKLDDILDGLSPEERAQVQQGQISQELLAQLTLSEEIITVQAASTCAISVCSSGLYSVAEPTSSGDAHQGGGIDVVTNRLQLSDQGRIDASTSSTSPGGTIAIAAAESTIDIALDNGEITAATSSSGRSGDLTLSASDSITIRGQGTLSAETSATGSAGDITVTTDRFTLDEGTKLTNTATETANPPANIDGTNVNLNANEMNLFGTVQILSETRGNAQAGNLRLAPNGSDDLRINLRNESVVSASTSGSGSGGSLLLSAPNQLTISGEGTLSAQSSGRGAAGQIQVEAQHFTLTDAATLSTSSSDSAQGGDININAGTSIFLSNQGLIETDAQGSGDGGNIRLATSFLIGSDNSDIIANARSGDGGKIDIAVNNIFNFEIQDGQNRDQLRNNSQNDISASSETGTSGEIDLNTIDVNPADSLAELPSSLVDASGLIDRSLCTIGNKSEFLVTPQGGLPSSPSDALSPISGWEDWTINELENAPLAATVQQGQQGVSASSATQAAQSVKLTEAKHWSTKPNGQIVLYAAGQEEVPRRSLHCHQIRRQIQRSPHSD